MKQTILASLLLASLAVNVGAQTPVTVDVYYAHLCPDSVRFVSDQLMTLNQNLLNSVTIDFIPFGKAHSVNNGQSFVCQHGPAECEGNRIQSCILSMLPTQQARINYVGCQMSFTADPRGWECAFRSGVNLNAAESCVEGPLGTQLQLEAERRTNLISPAFIPTIVFNGQFNQGLQDRAQSDFAGILCELTGQGVGC
ncbi:GILT-like protein 1 [Anopheles bellator]|uniref:GILT-like protein 1 n=1 Tax=Anopheles bellator TaxID=139047 RepID=UPI00264808B8|nr:GILT-like protein 1 [Anopheles bellator]